MSKIVEVYAMTNDFQLLKVKDIDGQNKQMELIMSFVSPKTEKQYIVYTKNEKRENDMVILYLSSIKIQDGNTIFENISDEERQIVKEKMKELMHRGRENLIDGNAIGSYLPNVAIQGRRTCMVNSSFKKILQKISFFQIENRKSSLQQKIKTLQAEIKEVEKQLSPKIEQPNINTQFDYEKYMQTKEFIPLKSSLPRILNPNKRLQLLEKIKRTRHKKIYHKVPLTQEKNFKLYPSLQIKYSQIEPPTELQINHDEDANNLYTPVSKDDKIYCEQVYSVINQFLKDSLGDPQGREQFYQLISACGKGYIIEERTTKSR